MGIQAVFFRVSRPTPEESGGQTVGLYQFVLSVN